MPTHTTKGKLTMTSEQKQQIKGGAKSVAKHYVNKTGILLSSLLGLLIGGGGVFGFYEYQTTGQEKAKEEIRTKRIHNESVKYKEVLESMRVDLSILQTMTEGSELSNEDRASLNNRIEIVHRDIISRNEAYREKMEHQVTSGTTMFKEEHKFMQEIGDLDKFLLSQKLTDGERKALNYKIVDLKTAVYCTSNNRPQSRYFADDIRDYYETVLQRQVSHLNDLQTLLKNKKITKEGRELLTNEIVISSEISTVLLKKLSKGELCEIPSLT